MTRLKSFWEALKTSVVVTVIVLWITGILSDWVNQYTLDPPFWRMVLVLYGMAMIIATICAIAIEAKHD